MAMQQLLEDNLKTHEQQEAKLKLPLKQVCIGGGACLLSSRRLPGSELTDTPAELLSESVNLGPLWEIEDELETPTL